MAGEIRRIRIGDKTVSVVRKRMLPALQGESTWEHVARYRAGRRPGTSVRLGRIAVDQGLSAPVESSTILHEAIHMVAAQRRIPLAERHVLALEAGLVDLLLDNPHLVRAIARGRRTP